MTVDQIKFRELKHRINSILSQLSGLSPLSQPRIMLLECLYKEIEHDLTPEENIKVVNLFLDAKLICNMQPQKVGINYTTRLVYHPKAEYMNEIELELRKLIGKLGYYEITKDNPDYQLGEE